MKFWCFYKLGFTKIYKRTNNRKVTLIQICGRQEGINLSRVENTHQKSFYGIIMMMSIGHFIKTIFYCKFINGTATKKRTGKARIIPIVFVNNTCNINFFSMKGYVEILTKACQWANIKIRSKHRINR